MRSPHLLLALLPLLPALVACPPAGECATDADCPEGEACRATQDDGNVCIEVINNPGTGDAGPEPAVSITSFTASPTTIDAGTTTTLSWASENATSCAIDGVGGVEKSGSVDVTPAASTTYTLSCQGEDGPALADVDVSVRVEITSFTVAPVEVNQGEEVTFSWETVSAESCSLVTGETTYEVPDEDLAAGEHVRDAQGDGEATLTCEGADGPVSESVSADVARVVTLTAEPSALAAGQSTTVSWTSEHLTGCAVTGATDPDPSDNTAAVTLTETSPVSLVCTGFRDVSVQRDLLVPVLILTFTADDTEVASGGSTTLRFTLDPLASSCEVNGTAVDLDEGSYATGALTATTDFVLTCEDDSGRVATSDAVQVAVQ